MRRVRARMKQLTERLADYAVAERDRPLATPLLHHARRALIDWFAALLPGTLSPPATLLASALADEMRLPGTQPGAIVYVNGRRANLRTAALINAAAAHTVEFDDIFRDAVYHPGSPVHPDLGPVVSRTRRRRTLLWRARGSRAWGRRRLGGLLSLTRGRPRKVIVAGGAELGI